MPLTSGCSNNTCAFCGYYGSKLGVREIEDVKREIDAVALYRKSGVRVPDMHPVVYAVARDWDGGRVFLQDGDALCYPFTRLREILYYLSQKMPQVERVAAYATPQDILRRSVAELAELKKLKVGILYMGVESGDDGVLQSIGKGVSSGQVIEAGQRVKDAGIILSVTVILGLGGIEGSGRHVSETARVLTALDPDYAGALTLTLVPGTPLHERWKCGEFHIVSPFRSLEELKSILENSVFKHCFFSSMHASNYLAVRGNMPAEKERMLEEINRVLWRSDPNLLRPESLRGL